jgi:hypothetical protein
MITIKNLRKEQPSEPWQIKVDRSSPLGNPFPMKDKYDDKERKEVCKKYSLWLEEKLKQKDFKVCAEMNKLYNLLLKYNKLDLYCWCFPKQCHSESIKYNLLKVLHKKDPINTMKAVMGSYGYELYMNTGDNSSFTFGRHIGFDMSISCTCFPSTNSFKFEYITKQGITLSTGKMSPYINENHFFKFEEMMQLNVSKLVLH